jgi:hypothetical protein
VSLKTNKRLITAKIESVYGTDPTPIGANAMLVRNLDVQPLQADTVSRDLIRPFLGISEQLLASKNVQVSFEVEYAASGKVGGTPAYDALLRACGFAPTITTTSVTAAVSSEVVTVTKNAHGLLSGDKIVTVGFTDTACNIDGVVITKTGANTFTYPAAGAADTGSSAGSPAYRTQIAYNPISSSFDSITIYFNVDGVLHKALGCRGTFEISLAVKQIPTLKFTFTGFYSSPTDTAAVTPDFTGFTTPLLPNTQNTPTFTLDAYAGILETFSLNVANQVEYKPFIGAEEVLIVNRSPAGQINFEAVTIATKNFWSLIENNTLCALVLDHGPNNGYKMNLSVPYVHLGNPTYQDSSGIQMLSTPFQATPSSSGNDEISIILK